ncbi:glycosyltransferase family A protein [Herbiconiux sp. KACC 21604]|uniref:glycosyltransferase n=1 Tax=unclassified Herbiconiux TaxID=2618217 RepID=UPI001490E303|nr:glycosyltransferase family A protein [Herbiconiux sp. SALV-R1]QJU54735.1 glycosyltransferase family 2 protein [Herbiconiux sp. SALV-R1]WPO85840.1 glycosyltransferase family A protein [Herbiconiux sp. KACC 21604]
MIERIDVVIPARDEEEGLGPALEAVLAARVALLERQPEVHCRVVVVLDACSDASPEVAHSWALSAGGSERDGRVIEVLEVPFGNVGRARAAGVELALDEAGGVEPAGHWLCSTDADSEVPESWLLDHLDAARAGALLALGPVLPAEHGLTAEARETWMREHGGTAERHVFGANLGVRADAYLATGGFPAERSGEDVALAQAVEAFVALAGRPELVVELDARPVTTSARLQGRAPGGFAGYLRTLVEGIPPERLSSP